MTDIFSYFYRLAWLHGTMMCLALYQYILLCLSIALQPFLLLQYWLPRAKLCSFSAKSDRCDSTTRRSDGPRRYKLASMKFNTFGETIFLRLPRSYRVVEKSDPIGSREPNYAVFQQNPTVAQARQNRRSDGSRRCNRASMNFNTFAGWLFLRLPRSYRVTEKSDPI